jgi:hypothetical protein
MSKKYNTPLWVKWALMGISIRKTAMQLFAISLFLSSAVGMIGVMIKDYSLWTLLFIPLWYWISIKWVDVFASWPRTKEND